MFGIKASFKTGKTMQNIREKALYFMAKVLDNWVQNHIRGLANKTRPITWVFMAFKTNLYNNECCNEQKVVFNILVQPIELVS